NFEGMVATVEDVTEKAVAEENLRASETKFRQFVQAAQEGMWAIDLDGNTTFVNPRMADLLGYAPEEMLDRYLFSFMGEEQATNAKEQMTRRGQHVQMQYEFEFLTKIKQPISTHVETNPLYDEAGNMVGVIACVTDITASNGMQNNHSTVAQLKQDRNHLADLVEQRDGELEAQDIRLAEEITEHARAEELLRGREKENNTLKRAKNSSNHHLMEVERSNQELDQFATIASHDLQAPLATVIGFLQLLKRRLKGQLDPGLPEFITRAVNAATHMQEMVSGLLTFSRVKVSKENLAAVDCDEVLESAIEDQQSTIAELSATVTHDPLPTVRGVKSLLAQVFQNLLSNALKFRGAAPPVIHVAVAESENDWIFTVQDNGIGFDQKDAESIFILFRRLHTQEKYAGNGIGLSTCKKIVERHGGMIWAESEISKGSTFYFTLPKLTA
ncbi:MAG TPA: ATP-binding protein, partial [Candidatus Lokiarchaeia archaeon]|nr:ATP-binding protein [Candidatus Lokiarchaeia archaeon]